MNGAALVAQGLDFPTSLAFDAQGTPWVAESGLPFAGAAPGGRVRRVDPDGEAEPLVAGLRSPVNGLCFYDGAFFVAEGGHPGRISRWAPGGERETVLDGLPGLGNYHTNMTAVGPDGWLYLSQGALTNSGVIGLDAYDLGWLKRLPHNHDVPGVDVVLAGLNLETDNPLVPAKGSNGDGRVRTGAFSPFGVETRPGQRIAAGVPCTASVMRCRPDGSGLERVAWGLRNAYGLLFLPDGRLIADQPGSGRPRQPPDRQRAGCPVRGQGGGLVWLARLRGGRPCYRPAVPAHARSLAGAAPGQSSSNCRRRSGPSWNSPSTPRR